MHIKKISFHFASWGSKSTLVLFTYTLWTLNILCLLHLGLCPLWNWENLTCFKLRWDSVESLHIQVTLTLCCLLGDEQLGLGNVIILESLMTWTFTLVTPTWSWTRTDNTLMPQEGERDKPFTAKWCQHLQLQVQPSTYWQCAWGSDELVRHLCSKSP